MIAPQSASVNRDVIRAAKQAVIVVAGAAGLSAGDTNAPDDLPAVVVGHSHGAGLTTAMALGVNPWRPGVPNGGNRLDPADLLSPPIAAGAIPLAPSLDPDFADVGMPLIPMILINGETDPLFGVQFRVAARYGEVLAGRGLKIRDRVSLWSLGNTAHVPPELWWDWPSDIETPFGLNPRQGGDRWGPFVAAALDHMLRIVSGTGDNRMPASHYGGRLLGDRVVFPQMGAPPTDLVPFVVNPRRDVWDDAFISPLALPSYAVDDFAAVAQQLRPTSHLLGPRMANPIGGYKFDFWAPS